MDKNVHRMLNTIEIICVLVGIVCICLAAMLRFGEAISGLGGYCSVLLMFGILAEVVVVSIELLLLYLQTIKFKFISISYYILELVAVMLVNAKIPFAGLLVLTVFSMTKNIFRLMKVDILYRPLGYYELCKKFGIKVKRPRKARVSAVKKKTTTVKKPAKARTTKATEPNYA